MLAPSGGRKHLLRHIPSFQLNVWRIYILQSPNVEAIRETPLHYLKVMRKSDESSPDCGNENLKSHDFCYCFDFRFDALFKGIVAMFNRSIRVFESIAGEDANDGGPSGYLVFDLE